MRPEITFYSFRKLKRLQLMVSINQGAGAHLANLFVPVRFFWNESASKTGQNSRYSTNSLWFIEQDLLGMLGSPRPRCAPPRDDRILSSLFLIAQYLIPTIHEILKQSGTLERIGTPETKCRGQKRKKGAEA